MKKLVLKLDLHDDKAKQKALKTVSTLQGIDSISMDMKEKKLTVIGTMDPVSVVSKLRKYWPTADLVTVGPAKEPEKKEEAKKEEPKKEEAKKEEPKKEEVPPKKEESPPAKKEEEAKKDEPKKEGDAKKEEEKKIDPVLELVKAYRAYNPHMTTHYYVQSIEENPNACVIF